MRRAYSFLVFFASVAGFTAVWAVSACLFTPRILASSLERAIQRPDVLLAAIANPDNQSFRCVRDGSPCRGGGTLDAEDFLYSGATLLGLPCERFAHAGNQLACPIQVQVHWQPLCLDPTCARYLLALHGEVELASGWPWLDRLFRPRTSAHQFFEEYPRPTNLIARSHRQEMAELRAELLANGLAQPEEIEGKIDLPLGAIPLPKGLR
jgi:hypothetical protein